MTGSLQIRGKKKMYHAVLSMKDESGKYKQKWIPLHVPAEKGNKRKAEAELKRVIAEYEAMGGTNFSDILFCDYLHQWLEEHRANITQGSYEGYKIYYNKHLYPYYSSLAVKLFDLKPLHIQNYYTQKLVTAEKPGLTANTLKKHHAIVRKCLQHALQMNLILYNPADRVTLPKVEQFKGQAFTVAQAKHLLEISKGDVLEVPIFLALQFGLRRSEALGLKWDSVDFDNEIIHIRRTVVAVKTRVEREGTKNRSSMRSLPMLGESKNYLLKIKAKQEEEKRLCGAGYDDSGYVCRWADGKPYSPSIISHNFAKLVKRSELPVIRFHDLRHSAASILIALGCNVKEVSVFLGHNQVSTTLDIYAHLFNNSSVDLMQKYDALLSKA